MHLALGGKDERIDLDEVGVAIGVGGVQLLGDCDRAIASLRIEVGTIDPLSGEFIG